VHVRPLAHALHAAGYRVASPEFARTGAPGGGWPGTFDDVRLAVTTVPALLGLAPSEVVLAGHSAGGHLALWAAGELVRAGTPPRGVLALAAVSDLVEAYSLNLDNGAVALLVGGGPREVPDRYVVADPMRRLPVGVPVAMVHGTEDRQVPVNLSRGFEAVAKAAGDDIEYVELDGVEHFALIDPESAAWPAVMESLRSVSTPF
jgi:acetyl esterase/lipase